MTVVEIAISIGQQTDLRDGLGCSGAVGIDPKQVKTAGEFNEPTSNEVELCDIPVPLTSPSDVSAPVVATSSEAETM